MSKYDDYQKIIEPVEKKYNRLLLLYSHFKCPFIKRKLDSYNNILQKYYQYLLKNENVQKELFKYFK